MNNCFAYSEEKCVILKEKNCEGCKFYKTAEQLAEENEKTKARAVSKGYYCNEKGTYEPLI